VLAANFRRVSAKRPGARRASTPVAHCTTCNPYTDFVHYLLAARKSLFPPASPIASGNIDHVVTQYIFDDGPVVHAEGSWLLTDGFNMAFTLHWRSATIDLTSRAGAGALQIARRADAADAQTTGTDGYSAEIRYS